MLPARIIHSLSIIMVPNSKVPIVPEPITYRAVIVTVAKFGILEFKFINNLVTFLVYLI